MKKKGGDLLMFLLIAGLTCKKQRKDTTAQETMEVNEMSVPLTGNEVEAAVTNFSEVMVVDPTQEMVNEICSDRLTYGHSSGLNQNKSEFIDYRVYNPFDFSSVGALVQTINISANTAIVKHIFLWKATNKRVPIDIRIGNVQVYQKENSRSLKLLARQVYKLPPLN